jgi:hypothetical protein
MIPTGGHSATSVKDMNLKMMANFSEFTNTLQSISINKFRQLIQGSKNSFIFLNAKTASLF